MHRRPRDRNDRDGLRAMMRPYEGPRHSVIAFETGRDGPTFIHSGTCISDAPCKDWIFEIASITKVFTGILLCLLVEEGRVDPQAPLREMAAELTDVPDWITPQALIAHTSGLPNLPSRFGER